MRLALFDLDHTLIPFDSGMAWTGFLAERGVVPRGAPDTYLAWCRRLVAGQASIHDVHRATVAPLAAWDDAQLQALLHAFERTMAPRLPADMQALVARHQADGDLCAIVTATTRLLAEPFARLFGIDALVATQPTRDAQGRLDGGIDGTPCHGVHKPVHVADWLARRGQRLASFTHSHFYSDSASDLPLLQAVTHPVAVRPEARLHAHALRQGWPILGDPRSPSSA